MGSTSGPSRDASRPTCGCGATPSICWPCAPKGTASLAQFALKDLRQQPVAGVDTLGVKLAEGDLGQMRFRFDRLYIGGFSLAAELTPEGDNISALMKSSSESPEQPVETTSEAPAGSAPVLQIADLEITGGQGLVPRPDDGQTVRIRRERYPHAEPRFRPFEAQQPAGSTPGCSAPGRRNSAGRERSTT